jgi:hypothetical protein
MDLEAFRADQEAALRPRSTPDAAPTYVGQLKPWQEV